VAIDNFVVAIKLRDKNRRCDMTSARLSQIAARRRRGRAISWFFACVGLALCAAWLAAAAAAPIAAGSLP